MAFNLDIPSQLAHLKKDSRGYPIPYFVSEVNGKPEFRFLRPERLEMIIERKLCHICGKKLPTDFFYFISGPIGLKNRISTDAAMHRICAEFSLQACPHLFLQKAERRDNDPIAKELVSKDPAMIIEKPDELFLVKCDKFRVIKEGGRGYIHYRPVSWERYIYLEGMLTKV
jgi:hypothetical protein